MATILDESNVDDDRSHYARRATKINFRRQAMSLKGNELLLGNKVTKEDLIPRKLQHHRNGGIDKLLFTVFDSYAQEYGEYF